LAVNSKTGFLPLIFSCILSKISGESLFAHLLRLFSKSAQNAFTLILAAQLSRQQTRKFKRRIKRKKKTKNRLFRLNHISLNRAAQSLVFIREKTLPTAA